MVSVSKKIIKGEEYYYLNHSRRVKDRVEKKELYLGKQIPENIEELKRKFILEIYKEKWFGLFDKIRKNYAQETKVTPLSAQEKEREDFAVRFTYNTQRIEGSKLSLRDTANLLERGITPKDKPVRDIKEAEAHKKLFYEMLDYKKDLTLQIVLYWNKKLLENTKPDMAGRIREHQVKISGSRFLPPFPAELQPLLREFFEWYGKSRNKLNPVELAALVHLKFVTIHPFGDGNGRISRMMMNFILNKNKLPMLDITYEKRNSYYNALERAQIKKDKGIFLQWFFRKYLDSNRGYLR
ncbi:Fic family protein [Candidatus Pacearchaeota archaeon]|nr:Fic family protein [Candidatus Pacearchaeota archaeon]